MFIHNWQSILRFRRWLSLFLVAAAFVLPCAAQEAGDSGASVGGSITGRLVHPLLRRFPASVYLESLTDTEFEPPSVNPVMDQVNLMFTPHVLPVLKGSTIDFPNSDETRHNVYTSRSSVCQFELGIYEEGIVKHVTCDRTGVIMVLCNVHAEMRGFIVVSPTPYFTATGKDGSFEISGVPAGRYRLVFEHERLVVDPMEVEVGEGEQIEVELGKPARKRR